MRLSWIKSFIHKVKFVPICLIAVYQRIVSPLISPACRFYPSCSTYARLAIEKYGVWRGGAMSLIRLCKCHPFHPGGYDPLT